MSKPQWLREAEELHGRRVAAGTETEQEARAGIAASWMEHPEWIEAVAYRPVGRWVRGHEAPDLFQGEMFPLLPAYLHVAVDRPLRVADMTLRDLDNAKSVLDNQVRNTMRGARKRKKAFDHFYGKVRPVLEANPGMTVAAAAVVLASEQDRAA